MLRIPLEKRNSKFEDIVKLDQTRKKSIYFFFRSLKLEYFFATAGREILLLITWGFKQRKA